MGTIPGRPPTGTPTERYRLVEPGRRYDRTITTENGSVIRER
jgi:hypothetical protein